MSCENNFKASCLHAAGDGVCVCARVCVYVHTSVLDVSVEQNERKVVKSKSVPLMILPLRYSCVTLTVSL